jgi:hypothetical protein
MTNAAMRIWYGGKDVCDHQTSGERNDGMLEFHCASFLTSRQTKSRLEAAHNPGKKADGANGRRRKGRGGEPGGGPKIDVGGQRATRRVEVRWQHASNGVKVAIHANFLADEVRVRRKPRRQ